MSELKLIAFDADDLAVISAHMQDAVLKVADLVYLPAEKRFAALGNRFDWVDAFKGDRPSGEDYARRQAVLRFEHVLAAKVLGIDMRRPDAVLSLLAVDFEPRDLPAGSVTLHFSDGGAIRLEVECIEAELKDLGPVWSVKAMPRHPENDPPRTG